MPSGAIRIARGAGARWVAGSLWAGLPDLPRQIAQLEKADIIWLESATSADQAMHAVRTAGAYTRLPIAITCAMRSAPLQDLREAGASAAGYNCTPWPDRGRDWLILALYATRGLAVASGCRKG